MIKGILNRKMIGLIMQQKTLRVSLLLIFIFSVILIALVLLNLSFSNKVSANESQIEDAKNQLTQLENIVNTEEQTSDPRIAGRLFAPYDEIVPYIELLESLFGIIDKDSKIIVRDKESQIMINRYADYEVTLKPGNKMELLFKALDELHKSKYITKVTQFVINYAPAEEGTANVVDEVSLKIRLYFE